MGLFGKNKGQVGPEFYYSEKEMSKYDAFLEETFGKCANVFHEIASPDIHLDVCIIEPTKQKPYYQLITMGAGAYKMHVPEEFKKKELSYAEYIICLPADWNLSSGDINDFWPVKALKDTARIPIWCDTWLAYGHTVQSDEDGSPYAPNTGFNCVLLDRAKNENGEAITFPIASGKRINFYKLIPIYPEEMQYKLRYKSEKLFERFAESGIDPTVVDINRPQADLFPIDDGENHESKILDKNLDCPAWSGYNHLAVFLRWAYQKGFLTELVLKNEPLLEPALNGQGDLRKILAKSKFMKGTIRPSYFTKESRAFVCSFYQFGDTGYPCCVDDVAEEYFGDRYYCEEFQNEAYLFVPYDENYYRALSRHIDEAWEEWKASEQGK